MTIACHSYSNRTFYDTQVWVFRWNGIVLFPSRLKVNVLFLWDTFAVCTPLTHNSKDCDDDGLQRHHAMTLHLLHDSPSRPLCWYSYCVSFLFLGMCSSTDKRDRLTHFYAMMVKTIEDTVDLLTKEPEEDSIRNSFLISCSPPFFSCEMLLSQLEWSPSSSWSLWTTFQVCRINLYKTIRSFLISTREQYLLPAIFILPTPLSSLLICFLFPVLEKRKRPRFLSEWKWSQ